jgi:hypothetical protein
MIFHFAIVPNDERPGKKNQSRGEWRAEPFDGIT